MLEAAVYFKPGTITNLIKESRLLKTALLFSNSVYTNNPELDSLIAVNALDDSCSTEHQYETILNAMPALNPTASIEHMRENLLQIKKLKKNNRKSSREIIALKKAQKQLKQINNTFRIITQTLFESSNFSSIASLSGKKVFFGEVEAKTDSISELLYLLDEELLKNLSQVEIQKAIKDKKKFEENSVYIILLYGDGDFDQFSMSSILKSQKSMATALGALLGIVKTAIQKKDLTPLSTAIKQFNTAIQKLPLKKTSKKIKTGDTACIVLGICSSEKFKQVFNAENKAIPLVSDTDTYMIFIYNKTIKKVKAKATKQVMLQEK